MEKNLNNYTKFVNLDVDNNKKTNLIQSLWNKIKDVTSKIKNIIQKIKNKKDTKKETSNISTQVEEKSLGIKIKYIEDKTYDPSFDIWVSRLGTSFESETIKTSSNNINLNEEIERIKNKNATKTSKNENQKINLYNNNKFDPIFDTWVERIESSKKIKNTNNDYER